MDITILFKACIKTVQTTNKALNIGDSKSNILKTTRKDPTLKQAKEIVKQLSNLYEFLLKNKLAYLNVVNYLSTNKVMTEIDREEVDLNAQKIISGCSVLIKEYKERLGKEKCSKQVQEHYNNVIESINSYLKAVSKVYAETKAIRVKRVIETHKLSKLETNQSKSLPRPNSNSDAVKNPKEIISLPSPTISQEDQISSEEMQMFATENEHLFNELNSLSDEVKQIESKVVHISELQELFTEKVLQQEKDIERISTTVVSATDNMRDANKQIRQAIQRNAGLRVWVLFFLLVMSFSLLFLDWYNA